MDAQKFDSVTLCGASIACAGAKVNGWGWAGDREFTRISRVFRHAKTTGPMRLRWGRLTPNYEVWIADATCNIDCHEAILYFVSRLYECLSHPRALAALCPGAMGGNDP